MMIFIKFDFYRRNINFLMILNQILKLDEELKMRPNLIFEMCKTQFTF